MEWKPIETAPKDGTEILVYVPSRGVKTAWYCEFTGLWPADDAYNDDGEPCNVGRPSHWMQIPAPPIDTEALEPDY